MIVVPKAFKEEGEGLPVLTQQIFLERWNIKSPIFAHTHLLAFLSFR